MNADVKSVEYSVSQCPWCGEPLKSEMRFTCGSELEYSPKYAEAAKLVLYAVRDDRYCSLFEHRNKRIKELEEFVKKALDVIQCGKDVREDLLKQDADVTAMNDELLAKSDTFSVPSIIEQLCIATDHLLNQHDCDCHAWEGRLYAAQAGWRWLHKHGYTDIPELPRIPMHELPKRKYETRISKLEADNNRLKDLNAVLAPSICLEQMTEQAAKNLDRIHELESENGELRTQVSDLKNSDDGHVRAREMEAEQIKNLLAEKRVLNSLIEKAVSYGWDCGHYGKPCDANDFLRANNIEEGT